MNDVEFQKYQRSLFLVNKRDGVEDSDSQDEKDSRVKGFVEDSDSASGILIFQRGSTFKRVQPSKNSA